MKIRIPDPCHEDWSAMTPQAKGRHCAACAKTVVDFTAMSDADVVSYLRTAGGSVCGRTRATQLDRRLQAPPLLPSTLTQPLRHGVAAATIALGVGFGVEAAAQTAPVPLATATCSTPAPDTTAPLPARHPEIMGMIAMPMPLPPPPDTSTSPEPVPGDGFEMGELAPIDLDPSEADSVAPIEAPTPLPRRPAASMIAGRIHVVRTPIEAVADTVRAAVKAFTGPTPPKPNPVITPLLYPNPSDRRATLQLLGDARARLVNVYSPAGQLVHARPVGDGLLGVDLEVGPTHPRGTYLVEVLDGRGARISTTTWVVR